MDKKVKGSSRQPLRIKNVEFNAQTRVIIAGPCAVESYEQYRTIAQFLSSIGVRFMRGGAFKPRSSPYSFQGLEEKGMEIIKAVGDEFGMATVSEVLDERSLKVAVDHVDMLQVGARNMDNYSLLKMVGASGKPVLLKRGFMAKIEEFLLAAEYLFAQGNDQVVLCERGIRTFEDMTRNTLDLAAIALIKKLSSNLIIADPSHGTGRADIIPQMARAALVAGADGLIIEVHNNPKKALSDGLQSLDFDTFARLYEDLHKTAEFMGVRLS